VPLNIAWEKFRNFKFELLAPENVKSVAWIDGTPARVGSTAKITYAGDVVWTIRVTEVSERYHTIAYELLEANPAIHVTSMQTELKLIRVSDDDTTFLSWTTEFSNDVDAIIISD